MSAQSIANDILSNIKRIYQREEDKARELEDAKRQQKGNKIDKEENDFIKGLGALEKNMSDLLGEMQSRKKGSPKDFMRHIEIVEQCLASIQSILKKPLKFKVNKDIQELIHSTEDTLIGIRKSLPRITDTKCLCFGAEGSQLIINPMKQFRVEAGKWKMLSLFESKDSVENFITPKFNQNDFSFVGQILRKKWPDAKVIQVEKIKYVQGDDKPSLLSIGNEFIFGINHEANPAYGLQLYHHQADNNSNVTACAFLGRVYQEGLLLPKDLKKAMTYYQKAMGRKDAYASYRYAMCLIKGYADREGKVNRPDIEKGYNLLLQISRSENSCAQANAELGELYAYTSFKKDLDKLFTVSRNLKEAIRFYNKARDQHLPRASNDLGVLFMNFRDSPEIKAQGDTNRKIMLFLQESKAMGFGQAYYNLGLVYAHGITGQINPEEALHMFYEGSLKGDYQCKIMFAYELMNQTSVMKEDYTNHFSLAIQWLEEAINEIRVKQEEKGQSKQLRNDEGEALYYLGLFYMHGFGQNKSPTRALSYFVQAANLDYMPAKNKVGDCYFNGYGTDENKQVAMGFYAEAAQAGNSDAMVNLGSIYLKGIPEIIQKSYKKAFDFFQEATKKENTTAMIHLSEMYRQGLGVPVNEEIATALLEQAAENKNATALFLLKQQNTTFKSRVLFEQLDNQFLSLPSKINLKQPVPYLWSIKGAGGA